MVDHHGTDIQTREAFVQCPCSLRAGAVASTRVAICERLVVVQADHDLSATQKRKVDTVHVREAAQRERGRAGDAARVDR